MKKHCLILVVMLSVAFLTCGDDNSTNPIDTSIVMPLKVGNCWEMTSYTYSYLPTDTTINQQTLFISGMRIIDNEYWYEVRSILNNDTGSAMNMCINREDGFWFMPLLGPDSYGAPYLMYKYPADQGDNYSSAGLYIHVESTATVVDVPYGSKTCYKYVFSTGMIGGPTFIDYLAPGVGSVYSESRNYSVNPEYQLQSSLELDNFIEGGGE